MKPLQQPDDLRTYYQDADVVTTYLERRTTQPFGGVLHAEQVRFLNEIIAERRPRTVLEVAPGPARLTAEITAVPLGLAVEFSPTMLQTARRRMLAAQRQWHFLRGDAFQLPVATEQIELAFTLRFVRHFDAEHRRRLYQEFFRVIGRGGALVVDALNRTVRDADHVERQEIFDQLYTREELQAELEGCGFRVIRMEGVIKHHAVQRNLNRLRWFGLTGVARRLIESLERVPSQNPSTWMVLCERQ